MAGGLLGYAASMGQGINSLADWLEERARFAGGRVKRLATDPVGLLGTMAGEAGKSFTDFADAAARGDTGATVEGLLNSGLAGPLTIGDPIKRAAPKFVNKAKRFKSGENEGVYRGSEAFGGITPSKLGSMRAQYVEDARAGAPYSKYWYDDTSKDLFRLAGHDVAKADPLAEVLATTSSSTPVGSNAMYGFKGWNQNLVGDPINTGKYPTRMSADIANIFAGNQTATGLKRSPYAGGLSVEWRPDPGLLAVNDIHNLRAWGIKDPKTGKPWSKGVGEAGHRFLQDQHAIVTERLNDRAAAEIQKARTMGVPESEIAKMDQPDWTNYRAQAAAWSQQRATGPNKVPLSESGKHYGDFLNDYSGQITREWVPGDNTGHARGLLDLPMEQQKAFSDALERAVTGPEGIDKVASGMGALTNRTLPNAGIYEGRAAPGYASQVMVGKALGSQAIDPSSAKVMDAVAAAHGLLGVQKQSAWNFIGGKAPLNQAGAFELVRGKPFTSDELTALRSAVPNADVPQVSPAGARVLSFDQTANPQTLKDLRAAAEGFGAKAEPRYSSTNLFPVDENFNAPATWSAKPYIEKIEAGGPKMVENFDKNVAPIAGELLKATEEQFSRLGLTAAPFYKPMMEGLAKGGLAELRRLVAAGIVPVAVLGLFGLNQEELLPQ